MAKEFWSVVIHLLRECGLAGQAWVSTTLKELAMIAEKVLGGCHICWLLVTGWVTVVRELPGILAERWSKL